MLTLPGIPFIYYGEYGEEIGMAASKSDPRLRTPMHWTRAAAAPLPAGRYDAD